MAKTSPTPSEIGGLIAGFADCAAANISDNLDRAVGARGLRAFHRRGRMCGTALTVRTAAGDNLYIHRALERIAPGDVLVVDGEGHPDRALVGEIIVAIARSKGAAGIVIDGAIRDAEEIAAGDFPVFARSTTHLGPYKNGPGAVGEPVSVGGMIVNTGDIVVGDFDGIVAFPVAQAAPLLKATRAKAAEEAEILASIAAGTYDGKYIKGR